MTNSVIVSDQEVQTFREGLEVCFSATRFVAKTKVLTCSVALNPIQAEKSIDCKKEMIKVTFFFNLAFVILIRGRLFDCWAKLTASTRRLC